MTKVTRKLTSDQTTETVDEKYEPEITGEINLKNKFTWTNCKTENNGQNMQNKVEVQ